MPWPVLANRRWQLSRIVSKTGLRVGDRPLITRSTSAVAVCCSSASRVSLKRRTFSIAITAWSAKVLQQIDLALRDRAGLRPGQRRSRRSPHPPGAAGGADRLRCASGPPRRHAGRSRGRPRRRYYTVSRSGSAPLRRSRIRRERDSARCFATAPRPVARRPGASCSLERNTAARVAGAAALHASRIASNTGARRSATR